MHYICIISLILEEKFWRLIYISQLWSHSFISFIPTYDLLKKRLCFVVAEAPVLSSSKLREGGFGEVYKGFYATLTEPLDYGIRVDQFKEIEPKLHPEVQEALKRLCEDPKTTIVVLSGCHHFVLDKNFREFNIWMGAEYGVFLRTPKNGSETYQKYKWIWLIV
nr:alpha,alpha-trehalose-phosphate synthase [UDP-forming] 1-like [Tanacetum cinerariifolium]